MQQSSKIIDEDVNGALWAITADVKAAMALSRAILLVLAAISPAMAAAAEAALDQEAALAAHVDHPAPQRIVAVLHEARDQLHDAREVTHRTQILERALENAAASLPETHEPDC